MILGKIKTYALLILGGLLTASVFLLKIFGSRMKRLEKQRDKAKAQATKQRIVMKKDVEIEEQTRSRRTDALKELEDTSDSPLFRDPNKLRKPRDS